MAAANDQSKILQMFCEEIRSKRMPRLDINRADGNRTTPMECALKNEALNAANVLLNCRIIDDGCLREVAPQIEVLLAKAQKKIKDDLEQLRSSRNQFDSAHAAYTSASSLSLRFNFAGGDTSNNGDAARLSSRKATESSRKVP